MILVCHDLLYICALANVRFAESDHPDAGQVAAIAAEVSQGHFFKNSLSPKRYTNDSLI